MWYLISSHSIQLKMLDFAFFYGFYWYYPEGGSFESYSFFFMYWEKIKKVDQENGKEMQDYDP